MTPAEVGGCPEVLSISSLSVSAWAVSASRDGRDSEWRNIPVFSFLIFTGLLRLMVPSLFAWKVEVNSSEIPQQFDGAVSLLSMCKNTSCPPCLRQPSGCASSLSPVRWASRPAYPFRLAQLLHLQTSRFQRTFEGLLNHSQMWFKSITLISRGSSYTSVFKGFLA